MIFGPTAANQSEITNGIQPNYGETKQETEKTYG